MATKKKITRDRSKGGKIARPFVINSKVINFQLLFQLFFVLLQCFRFVRKLLLLEEIIIINNHIIFSSTIETISSTILLFFLPSSGEASRLKPITTFVATLVCYSLVDRCSSLRRVLKKIRNSFLCSRTKCIFD